MLLTVIGLIIFEWSPGLTPSTIT